MSNTELLIKKFDEGIALVQEALLVEGVTQALKMSEALIIVENALTTEHMKNIMLLQGTKLGFRTDRDNPKSGDKGYPEHVVKKVFIEAVLKGLQPCMNHFNIIAGNLYITKEGLRYIAKKKLESKELEDYEILCDIPDMRNQDVAIASAHLMWKINGKEHNKNIKFAVKSNSHMTHDGIIGKAERKALAWLLNRISGINYDEADIDEINAEVIETKINNGDAEKSNQSEEEIIEEMIQESLTALIDCKTVDEVNDLIKLYPKLHDVEDWKTKMKTHRDSLAK